MWVKQAFRFELSPNEGQRRALAQHLGAARFAYNWGLEMCKRALEEGKRLPSAAELHREWNRWKRENAPGWQEVSKCAPQEAFRDLEQAFKAWRAGRGKLPPSGRSSPPTTRPASPEASGSFQGTSSSPASGG